MELISKLMKDKSVGNKRYNVPAIMVICPDTYNVVDLNKLFVEKFKVLDKEECPYDVHVQKLFAKHIKPEEQKEMLSTKHPHAKERKVLNLYLGTPNRLLKLLSMGAYDPGKISDRFRHLVIDCRLSKKGFSIFEQKETKQDTLSVVKSCSHGFLR